MADLSQVPHVVKHVAHAAPAVFHGVSYLAAFIYSAVSLAVGFGLGWYIKGRGLNGVKIDIDNIKTDIENLKAKLSAPVATA